MIFRGRKVHSTYRRIYGEGRHVSTQFTGKLDEKIMNEQG